VTVPARSNGGPDKRGSNAARRRRRAWLLVTFGDGTHARCHWCPTLLDIDTVTVDRYPVEGRHGGTYRRDNIVPACASCNYGRSNVA
jgi:hypothetical protein